MAAFGRLCRFAVNLSAKTRHISVLSRNRGTNGQYLGHSPLVLTAERAPYFLVRHLSSTPGSRQVESEQRTSLGVESEQDTSLGEMISDMVHQERRFGNVDSHLFKRCLEQMKQTDIGSYEALQLIRATRSVVQLPAFQRNELFEMVWSHIVEKDVALDISHYNAALRAKLGNKTTIEPTEFLLELEEKGITPNRVTYELLIASYCEKGDVEGARQILEFLKQKDLPINIVVFNTLVKGHLRKGDVEGARGMLDHMREAGLEPNGDTYKVLMCGHAEQGNIEALRQTLAETKAEVVLLMPHHLFSVVYSLAAHGHSQHITEMLDVIQESSERYHRDGKNCMVQLMASGYVSEAYTVYRGLQSSTTDGPAVTAPLFIRLLVNSNRPYDEVVTYITKLKEDGELSQSIPNILSWTLSVGDTEYCKEVINHKQADGHCVESTEFVANLRKLVFNKDIEGVYRMMSLMVQTCPSDRLLLDILFREAVMPLKLHGESEETLTTRLQEFGCSSQDTDQLRVYMSVVEGRYEDAISHLNSGTQVRAGMLKRLLPGSYSISGHDAHGLAQILQKAAHNLNENITHTASSVMLDILQNSRSQRDTISQRLIQAYTQMKVPVMDKFREPIQELLANNVPETTLKDFDVLVDESKMFKIQKFKQWSKMGVAELEKEHSSLVESGSRSFPMEATLLSKYCSAGNKEKADELTALLDSQGYHYSPSDYRQLALLAVKNNDLDASLHYKQKMESEDPEFTSFEALVLQIARLQVQEGKLEDALQLLKEFAARPDVQESRGQRSGGQRSGGQGGGYPLLCKRLADTCMESCPPDGTRQLVDSLYDMGYLGQGDPSVLGYIIRAHINSDDNDGALEAFRHCVSKYDKPVWLRGLIRLFIEKEDSRRLQKLIEILPAKFNEAEVWASIACRFIESGKLRKARKLLQNPQVKVEMKALINECNGWLVQKRVREMEQLVNETRDLPNIDREEILFQLMRIYVATHKFSQALDVLSTCEEEDIIPRERTLRYLAKVLKAENLPVPFHVPEVSATDHKRRNVTFDQKISKHDPETPSSIASQLSRDPTQKLNLEEAVDLIKYCLSRNQAQQRKIQQGLSGLSIQDLKELQSITQQDLMTGDLRSDKTKLNITRSIHRNLLKAYLESERPDEMLEELACHPEMLETGLTTQIIITAFSKGPQLTEKFGDLLMTHCDKEEVFSRLLYAYIIQGDRGNVDFLLEKRPHFVPNLGYVCRHAQLNDKEDVLSFCLTRFSDLPNTHLAPVYNEAIHLKYKKMDWEGALDYYHRAQDKGYTTQELSPLSLNLLEKLLTENSQPLPWPAGSLQQKVKKSKRTENVNSRTTKEGITQSINSLI